MDGGPSSGRARRSAAQKASAKVAAQISSSESGSEDNKDSYGSAPRLKRAKRRPPRKKVANGRPKPGPSKVKRTDTTIKRGVMRDPRSQSDSETDVESPLTDIASLDGSLTDAALKATPRPLKRLRTRDSITPPPSSLAPPSRTSSITSFASFTGPSRPATFANQWSTPSLGTLVWALVDRHGSSLSAEEASRRGGYWWPAKVSGASPFRVKLLEPIGPNTLEETAVPAPSASNILSMKLLDSIRFTASNYQVRSRNDSGPGAGKSQIDMDEADLDCRFHAALEAMKEEDELPSDIHGVMSHRSSATIWSPKKVKIDRYTPEELWEPPEADIDLDIPGELVLARTNRRVPFYPARLKEYLPPRTKDEEPRYVVEFMDMTSDTIPRKFFFTQLEDGFETCKLGDFDSAVKAVEHQQDNFDWYDVLKSSSGSRSPSPEVILPMTAPFEDLPIRRQLAYLKPVLCAVLDGKYTPALEYHESFMKGGKARAALNAIDRVVKLGVLDEQTQQELTHWIYRLVMSSRDQDDAGVDQTPDSGTHQPPLGTSNLDDNADTSPAPLSSVPEVSQILSRQDKAGTDHSTHASESACIPAPQTSGNGELPRSSTLRFEEAEETPSPTEAGDPCPTSYQRGTQSFHSLNEREKLDYCSSVLMREAVYQLLLWRKGARTCPELQSDEKERELRQAAEEEANKSDWVHDVMRIRRMREAMVTSSTRVQSRQMTGPGGTRSRPK
ncbi:hypothetical protein PUNSTDRAFT_135813 [Punctularia strigosozonata HHB-11173 SS5]|uniref:uncharacterized protein n=1 Tax=Punctularia strigosozonata (strain HHB-11173) TaxID=741275 RepID=UPI00044169B7|nr:uncharacterized protein PUNSTDRAFT_135813 [Punctularia strigosozonata HHB-11173 SS5]EIN07124.1 hypothetical protein PUNSTDRAFT_135813 [Punctularia strigosozonata HHB-11173 SS5]